MSEISYYYQIELRDVLSHLSGQGRLRLRFWRNDIDVVNGKELRQLLSGNVGLDEALLHDGRELRVPNDPVIFRVENCLQSLSHPRLRPGHADEADMVAELFQVPVDGE